MRGNQKYAWITTAIDEETAIQATVLGKSLARVITIADIIVLVSEDVQQKFRKLLARHFDSVVQVNTEKQHKRCKGHQPTMDLLKMYAMNLEMYAKIVLVNPNSVVLQNCDQLFHLEKEYYTSELDSNQNRSSSPVFVIKPDSEIFGIMAKAARSRPFRLSDVFTTSYNFFDIDAVGELSKDYSTKIKELELKGDSATFENSKIVSYDSFVDLTACCNAAHNIQELTDFWNLCWAEIHQDLNIDVGTSLNLGKNLGNSKIYNKEDIAIVGYSCRFPGANNTEEFWELLKTGGDGIGSIPMERIETLQLHGTNLNQFKGGFLKCPIDEFDAKFFGISPREAELIDPQQRLLLEVAWEALENAAINPHSLKGGNTGVFTGVWQADYQSIVKENTSISAFHNVILGNSFSATSARLSYVLGLNGPNIATESGCSSSMVALHLASESLKRKETDLGLVMGGNLVIQTQMTNIDIPVLAKDGHCKTFDEKADGFGRAEGIAVIVIKRLSDAIKKGDRVMGIIRGSAMSNEGTSSSFGTPSKFCQEIAVRDALKNSGVNPKDVDYVEAHGTGTAVGDPVEFAALSAGYAGKRDKPLIIGSVKTNIGHTESAAGLAGVIKVILSMKHETIPPHRNFDILNPNINLASIPAMLPLETHPWKKNVERVRIAGVSSFGISGTNVHVLLEEPPTENKCSPIIVSSLESQRTHHILNLSAKTENALADLVSSYIKYLNENSEIDIRDLTFTANNGRAHFKHRLSVVAKDISQLTDILRNQNCVRPAIKGKATIAFLFTGQGSQYSGMANDLYRSNSVFRNAFNKCSLLVEEKIGVNLKYFLWGETKSSPVENCVSSQISIFCVEYSLMKLLLSLGVKPDFVLGHSIGEYAAAVASGIIDLKDALVLLIKRSKLIAELPPGGMAAVATSQQKVKDLISMYTRENTEEWIDIAAVNSPLEVVVAGNNGTLTKFLEFCKNNNNIHSKSLNAVHAFHSRDVDTILKSFQPCTKHIKTEPDMFQICRYVSGTTGLILDLEEMKDGSYWLRHARESVNFKKGMETLSENGCNIFVEIGPRPILLALGMENTNTIENTLWLPTLQQNKDNWEVLLESLGKLYVNGIDICWPLIYGQENRKKLELPTYPFQRQKYWINIPEKHESKKLHPLLGSRVSFASIKETVYSNVLNLAEFSYIKDHQVANVVIMPGAGFLEIILAAGKDLLQKDNNSKSPIHVQDFVIDAAFELEEGMLYEMQVVAIPKDNSVLSVSVYIFSKLNGWKKHCSAFTSLLSEETMKESQISTQTMESIKSRCQDQISPNDFYKETQKSGINFGEAFQSIETIWTSENESLAVINVKSLPGNVQEYLYHPIILDAMLQTMAISMKSKDSGLYLPIGIENCFSFDAPISEVVFAHTQVDPNGKSALVTLYNTENELLFVMKGIRLIRTTIGSFLNNIGGQKNTLPGLFEEIWRPRLGPLQARLDLAKIPEFTAIKRPLEKSMKSIVEAADFNLHKMVDDYIYLKLLKLFNDNGLVFDFGVEYITRKIIQENCISLNHTKFLNRIVDIFVEEGNVVRIANSEIWKVVTPFPTPSQIACKLESLWPYIKEKVFTEVDIIDKCFDNLWNVFTGKLDAVTALFGREDMNILDVYAKGLDVCAANVRMGKFLRHILMDMKGSTTCKKENAILRIIEIGGGSASSSKEILKDLQQSGISYDYTFTDISAQFFENAKKELSSYEMIDYKVLDIEKDISIQGFCPNYYDVVIASNVIHATENLRVSIGNIRKLLANGGMLLLQEVLQPWRALDIIFGILDSFWRFSDYDLRKSNPMVSKKIWDLVLAENSFDQSVLLSEQDEWASVLVARAVSNKNNNFNLRKQAKSGSEGMWLLFCDDGPLHKPMAKQLSVICEQVKILKHGQGQLCDDDCSETFINMLDETEFEKNLRVITASNTVSGIIYLLSLDFNGTNENELYLKTLHFCKYLAKNIHVNAKVCVVTRGAICVTSQEQISPSGAIIWGMLKNLKSEVPKLSSFIIDLDPNIVDVNVECQQIFFEIFNAGEPMVSYRNRKKFVARYVQLNELTKPLTLPKGGYKLQIPKTKRIEDLCFRPMRSSELGPNDVEIMVRAISLNFRDILVILKPEGYHTLFDTVGSDFAGIVSNVGPNVIKFKVGDEVFGAGEGTAASHIVLKENGAIFHKPAHFSIFEASTIPSTFLTAHYCLVTVANLKKDETVLIHVASGGVGLFAIQIAQHIGARIIVTAGSHRKRSYLRSLGLDHIFHSRDLSFGEAIKTVTEGHGVDVVLNSLTSEGFKETTLENCALGARFVEIGKINIWEPVDIQKLRPDVVYTIVDLEKVDPGILADSMKNVYRSEIIKPVPYSRFDLANIRNGLNYFMKAKHIGKIVLSMPETSKVGTHLATKEILFNKNATYLITGGLGGIGLAVAKWMVASGAGNLVLVGRSSPNESALSELSKLRSTGCRILTFEVDIGNLSQCEDLFEKISSHSLQLPPLKGVIHSAGVLSDATFANQTWEKYQKVFNAKVSGCLNLHNLTKGLQLEYFVLFSSMAAKIALIGQSNHCAANTFLDAFAHYRHSIGLPAQSVNWGAWSEIGAAANLAEVENWEHFGLYSFNPRQGIAALQFLMSRPNLVQLGVVQLNASETQVFGNIMGNYFKELWENGPTSTISNSIQSITFWEDVEPLAMDERVVYIKKILVNLIRDTLKLPKDEQVNENQPFPEMGLDSLMFVELKNKLQGLVGDRLILNAVALVDHPTINGLSDYLSDATFLGKNDAKSETQTVTVDGELLNNLIKQDSLLPDDIRGTGNVVNTCEVRNIFLTGGSGHLGAYLIEKLAKIPYIKIICLVRGPSIERARKRLIQNLKKYKLSVDFERISVVKGDVALEQFGMAIEEYQKLSENVDAVYHLAAKVNFAENYTSTSANKSDIRSANVLGTINILRFAANIKTKRVFYSSTMMCVNQFTSQGFAHEEFPDDENNAEGIAMGYYLTKFVGEKLVKQAISRGIPCIAIRYPNVMGNSRTGHFNVDRDLAMNIMLIALKLGVILDTEVGWSFLSADIAADLTVDIILNNAVSSGMYNLFQPNGMNVDQLTEIANNNGYNFITVSKDEFFEKLHKESDNSFLSFFNSSYGPNFLTSMSDSNSFVAKHFLASSFSDCKLSPKVIEVVPDVSERIGCSRKGFARCFSYAKSSGILKQLGIYPNC